MINTIDYQTDITAKVKPLCPLFFPSQLSDEAPEW